jgi:hypothetical protein
MRFYYEENLTPILQPNPRWKPDGTTPTIPQWVRTDDFHDNVVKLGYNQLFMVYDGTLNRALLWDGQSGPPSGVKLDWSNPNLSGNFSHPPTKEAVQACAKLSMTPSTFQGTAKPYCPMIFDIEGGDDVFYNTMYYGGRRGVDQLKTSAQNMLNAIRYIREINGNSPIYWYGLVPPPFDFQVNNQDTANIYYQMLDLITPVANELTGADCCFYFWNAPAVNPDYLITQIKQTSGLIRKYYPNLYNNRIATICPAYQIYWNDQTLAKLNNTPVPWNIWKKFVDFLVDDGWDIHLWAAGLIYDQYHYHAEYIASKGKNI